MEANKTPSSFLEVSIKHTIKQTHLQIDYLLRALGLADSPMLELERATRDFREALVKAEISIAALQEITVRTKIERDA